MGEDFLLWGFGLFGLAALLLFIEVFVPAGGIIGGASAISAIAGVIAFFRHSTTWGLLSLLALLVLAPAAIAFALKIWPNTPIGRRLILDSDDVKPDDATVTRRQRQQQEREALLNTEGVALTNLHPGGTIRIGSKRYDALAEGPTIEKGERIRVVGFEAVQVKVRRAE